MRTILSFITILLTAAFLTTAALGQPANVGTVRMSIPGVKGVLELEVGPTTWQTRVRPDGIETQMRAMNRPDQVLVTAFLQKVEFAASAEKCRKEWWPGTEKNLKIVGAKLQDLRQSTRDGMAQVEFINPEFRGKAIRQKSVHAYLGIRDLCAEVHISKDQFQPQDQKLFDEVLATMKLWPDEPAAQGADPGHLQVENELVAQASRSYLQRDYAAAAERYQKVLDREKQKPTLNKTTFRVVVDNLGMSYGLTGKLDKAKETFEYGVTQQPDYPMFYYNLACTYGEMGKMDEALEQLRLAYNYKANMIPGEGPVPDPLKDDSFRNFVKQKKFVDAVKEMQQ